MKWKQAVLIIGIATGMVVAMSGLVSASDHCDETVEDGESIQSVIDGASTGDVICVDSGTFEEDLTIDTAVTIEGLNAPDGSDAATVDGTVSIEAEGVTLQQIRVEPTGTLTPDLMPHNVDPFGIRVTASDVTVANNVVTGITGDAANHPWRAVNGIQVFNGDAQSPVTDIVIHDNTVSHLNNDGTTSAYGGAAAIKVQGVLDGVDVAGNTVENIDSAGWSWGIVMTTTGSAGISPEDVTVTRNTIDSVDADVLTGTAFGVDGDSDAEQATVNDNNFLNVPVGVENKDGNNTLDATNNYWGHASGPSERTSPSGQQIGQGADIVDHGGGVDWQPFRSSPVGQAAADTPAPAQRGPR